MSHKQNKYRISRRKFFNIIGIGVLAGGLGYSRFSKPKPTVLFQDTLDLPYRSTQDRSVVIVGGGLAGLASAYELSKRGFRVTLIERSPQLGGKIASWPIQVGQETMMMEHGFHGFFPQYYNLKSIVSELNIEHNFISLSSYAVLYKGKQYDPEVFYPSNSAFPWNIVDLAIRSPNRFQWGINLTKLEHWQVFRAITGFQTEKTYKLLDNISVENWVKGEFPKGLYDLYFHPFAKSTLNSPDVLSAGELMQFFHFYFFGNPEGLAFNGTRQDMGRSLVQPINNFIISNGGQIITSAAICSIDINSAGIQGLTYELGDGVSNVPFRVQRNPYLQAEGISYYGAGDRLFATTNQKSAISLTCSHAGCTVKLKEDGMFHCPCHGAIFDQQGKVITGPAKRDLTKFNITQQNDQELELVAAHPHHQDRKTIKADYYIFATDVPGVQHLFNLMNGPVNPVVKKQIIDLAIADPFAVARFWLDRDFTWKHSDFTSLSGYKLTDSITLYHRIQDDYRQWAQKTGGSVVELHAYCYKESEFPTQEALLATFLEELYQIVPELQTAHILHQELVNQKNFAGYPPGSYDNRPQSRSQISNLLFAGDWVKMPFPCGLMERAISSGLLAANSICSQEGIQRRPILSVNPQGLLQI